MMLLLIDLIISCQEFGRLECLPATSVKSWARGTNEIISGGLDLAASIFNKTFTGFKGRTLRVGVLEVIW